MLSHLDRTIEKFLKEKLRELQEKFENETSIDIDISFDIPTKEWASKLSTTKPTINIYLYDIRENRELRSNEWELKRNPDGTVTKERPSVRLDAFYMITVWSPAQTDAVLEEHHLLSQILAVLFKYPFIPEDVLTGKLANIEPPPKLPITVACPDAFKDQGVGQFWNAVDQYWKPFIHLIVTVPIDLQEEIRVPAVTTKIIKYETEELIQIGGRVVEASDPSKGIAGATVSIIQSGKIIKTTKTDEDGYFKFSGLKEGTYILKATKDRKEVTEEITLQEPERVDESEQIDESYGNIKIIIW